MRPRLRTGWLEIAAGFHLLFAAVVAYAPAGGSRNPAPFGMPDAIAATMLLLAAFAVFLLHPMQASRGIRRCLFLFAGLASAFGAARFAASGEVAVAILQAGYSVWMLAVAAYPRID